MYKVKTYLSKLLQHLASGTKVMLAKVGKPIARIAPFVKQPVRRVPGSAKGKIWISPDFSAPLPDEIIDAFEGNGR